MCDAIQGQFCEILMCSCHQIGRFCAKTRCACSQAGSTASGSPVVLGDPGSFLGDGGGRRGVRPARRQRQPPVGGVPAEPHSCAPRRPPGLGGAAAAHWREPIERCQVRLEARSPLALPAAAALLREAAAHILHLRHTHDSQQTASNLPRWSARDEAGLRV